MGQDQINQLLQRGIAAARGNRPDVARGIFQQVLNADPRNEVAWAWLATIARNNQERLIFLRKLWEINPENEFALKGLRALGVEPSGAPAPRQSPAPQAPPSSVPFLDDARFGRAQQAADEFLMRYNPEPPDELALTWERRQRNRYGERGAQRLRQMIYAVAALVFILVVGIVIIGLTQVAPSLFEGEEIALATRVPTGTPIPSLTPTQGGPTPTAFPANMAIEPTALPSGLPGGEVYHISSPTPIEPRPDPNIVRVVEAAVDHYTIGEYEEAARILREERERSIPCYPHVVYYEALSYAQMGELSEAESLLEWAETYTPPQRQYADCKESPLIAAGRAQITYQQRPTSQTALALSEQALDEDPDLIPAVLTKARVLLAQGLIPEAWQAVNRVLQDHPHDTNLLLLLAEIELADEQPGAALEYIGQALYIDPDLLPGLYLQAEAYLMLAEQARPPLEAERRRQAFGLAVRSAQSINRYYEGDVRGYLYLAQARIGEGNEHLAEAALTRILAVEDRLPTHVEPVINEAHRLRGVLYFRQGRFNEALDDLQVYARRADEPDTGILEMLVESALKTGDYSLASSWITQMTNLEPNNPEYQLWRARLWVETCTLHPDELTCRYSDALSLLSDGFVNRLATDAQRASAYSYRGQARYLIVVRQGEAMSDEQRIARLQQALDDVSQALELRESALDHYYRGILLEELGEPAQAFEEYQWLDFWRDRYVYPFVRAGFESRFAAVTNEVRDLMADAVVIVTPPTPPPVTPSRTITPSPVATETAEPGEPEVTATPQVTPTAVSTATALPAADIP